MKRDSILGRILVAITIVLIVVAGSHLVEYFMSNKAQIMDTLFQFFKK